MDWFNEVFDLAAVASAAGLAGSGGAAILAWMVRGAIMRFILRTLLTAVLTGIGFYILLGVLGFEIVPKEDAAARGMADAGVQSFVVPDSSPELAGAAPAGEDTDKRRIVVSSPFRKDG